MNTDSKLRFGRPSRWILVSAAVLASAVVLGVTLLALNWPFTETAVTKALEDRFARDVTIRKFRSTYFPPGCVAEGTAHHGSNSDSSHRL